MRISRLSLTNVRAIETAKFHFQPGFNLVAGINGVGKTTVLDSLAASLSAILGRGDRQSLSFRADDVRIGTGALQLECAFDTGGKEYVYTLHRPRDSEVPEDDMTEWTREQSQPKQTPKIEQFYPGIPERKKTTGAEGRLFAILFSTYRAVPSDKAPPRGAAAGGVKAAYAGALSSRRGLHLAEFGAWIRVQEALSSESLAARRVLKAFNIAVTRFLPNYRNIRVDVAAKTGSPLVVDRGATTVPVRLLSDGERGILAMVLDLTRRLTQANPEIEDPAGSAEAVVLIDEIELHLHPGWQRRIVGNLTKTFPKCQFIATTHSPQVIGEVEHDRIHIIANGAVYPPSHSFGVDSSRLLEEVMETDARTSSVKESLSSISEAIRNDQYDQARQLLAELATRIGESDPEVTRVRTLLDFMAGEE